MEDAMKKMTEQVQKEMELTRVEEVVKSNEVVFEFGEKTFRVKPPSYKTKMEAYEKKVDKFTQLLTEGKYKLEEDLKKTYKARGIDVDDIQKHIDSDNSQKEKYLLKLGEALEKKAPEADLEALKDEIKTIESNLIANSIKKTSLLQYSLENQVLVYVYQWLTFVNTEKKDGDNWVKAWDSMDKFFEEPEELINRAMFNTTMFVGQI